MARSRHPASTVRRHFASIVLACMAATAQAGRDCEPRPLQVDDIRQAMAMAERTARALDASGAGVVVLARAGQDLRRHGLQWSHLGLAYRDAPGAPWRVMHKLNHCGTAEAAVYRQGLGEFFLDRPWRYEAAYAVLSPNVQARLHPLLRDDRRVVAWHEPAYNMVAYPWSQRYQQSNQWAIETLAGAMEPAAGTRRQAQSWLQLHDYRPTTLHAGRADPSRRQRQPRQHRLRRPSAAAAFQRPHRHRDRRFGVRLAWSRCTGRPARARALTSAGAAPHYSPAATHQPPAPGRRPP